jgi:methylmalonyl-CoA decarboxylase subunit alpha
MSSKHLRGDVNYSWPSGEIAVMGPKGAIEVLRHKKIEAIENEEERAAYIIQAEEEYKEKFANPYNAARYGYIDDIIEPRNTRFRVIRALQSLTTKKVLNLPKKHSNLPL